MVLFSYLHNLQSKIQSMIPHRNKQCQTVLRQEKVVVYFSLMRGGSRRIAKYLQESTFIAFDFIWKILLSDTLLDPSL